MAILPLDQAVPRFQANDDRLNTFVNGDENTDMVTSGGQAVPSIRKMNAAQQADFDAFMADSIAGVGGKMDKSANLSDVANAVAARQNIGLGNAFSIDPALAYRGFSEIDGVWTISSATTANVDGYMRITATGLDPIVLLEGISLSGAANRYVAIRYRIMNGVRDGGVYWATTVHPTIDGAYRAVLPTDGGDGVWQTVVVDMWNPALGGTGWKDGTVTALRFDFNSEVGAVADIAWIAICADAIPLGASETASMKRDVVPDTDGGRSLGSLTKGWLGHFKDILLSGAAGTLRRLTFATAGSARWRLGASIGGESGGNVGSTFALWRCGDDGNDIDTPFIVDRPTGRATFFSDYFNVKNATGDAIVTIDGSSYSLVALKKSNIQRIQFGLTPTNELVVAQFDANGVYQRIPFKFAETGVASFSERPTWNGTGLATVDEVASGGTGVAGVSSFNGRTGAVIGQAGDYTSIMITHGGTNVEALFTDLYNHVQNVYTPEMYGAYGDDVTDDGAALQAMLDALPTTGCIVLLTRRYKCNRGLTLSKSGVRFIGAPGSTSTEGSWIKFGGVAALADDIFKVNANATTFDGIGFYLDDGPGATYFILRINGSNTRINHCTFTMPSTIAGRCGGVWFMHGNRLRMSDNRFVKISGYANLLQSSVHPNATTRGSTSNTPDILETERNIFTGVNGDFQTKGVVCGGNGGSYLDNGNVYLFLEYGFLATEVSGQNSSFFWLRSKGYETIQKDAIRLNAGAQAIIQGTYIGQSGQTYQDVNGVGIVAASSFGGAIIISGCEIRGQKRHGINIACNNVTVVGNYITECNTSGQASTYGLQMSGGTGYVANGNNFNSINDPAGTTSHSYDMNIIPSIATKAAAAGNMCPKGIRYSTGVALAGNAGTATAV